MKNSEVVEDILLNLLIYNVDNREGWMRIDLLKLKMGNENIEEEINSLVDDKFVELKNKDYLRITKEGIDYIVQKV
ncbi:MAG TPA: hypothetical protein ENI33_00765 [Thermoplasmatales archaeon]|nr:hypothetical protein [Thermoplasmatales archaeon]